MEMAYYAAQVKKVPGGYQATCEIDGKLGVHEWADDAWDEGGEHDTMHGYDGEGDYGDE